MNSTLKSLLFWLVLVAVGALIWHFATNMQSATEPITFSDFLTRFQNGQIQEVSFVGNEMTGTYNAAPDVPQKRFRTYMPPGYEGLTKELINNKVIVQASRETVSPWTSMLITWAPILLMIGFWIFIMRQMQSGGNKALSFGKSRAKLSSSTQKKVTFKDVAGADEAKE
ncbi:MAG TPA: ATP-dependent metallopeptidase FtsH/Yme1/Tma family protein, partial [Vicinamibacterales bacterium]|nr:ATP-dependent metallopeptidase FtsH/Yme1/Tma family protein [Vicinamibacterales bacterium]